MAGLGDHHSESTTRKWWPQVWRAVSCHAPQVSAYEKLKDFPPELHKALT